MTESELKMVKERMSSILKEVDALDRKTVLTKHTTEEVKQALETLNAVKADERLEELKSLISKTSTPAYMQKLITGCMDTSYKLGRIYEKTSTRKVLYYGRLGELSLNQETGKNKF